VTFFESIAVHVRFLLVLPLLVLVEASIGRRTREVAHEFADSGVVREGDLPRFESLVRTTRKLADSNWAEAIMAALAYLFMWLSVRQTAGDGALFWFEQAGPQGEQLSVAGWWYALTSPIVAFLFLRWLWRYGVWSWFLLKLSRFDLHVVASHPDRAGGVGFVTFGQMAFRSVILAASCVVAAAAATRILHDGATLASFQNAIVTVVVISVVVGIAPLLVFAAPLARAKREGLYEYGRFASAYVQTFERKWLEADAPGTGQMLGSADIQSLADLGGSFERITSMRPVILDHKTIIAFVVASAAPMIPLLLTEIPLREILKLLAQAVM
jgi:hypothetical protein